MIWQPIDFAIQHLALSLEDESVRLRLYDYYRSDNEELFAMLGKAHPFLEARRVAASG